MSAVFQDVEFGSRFSELAKDHPRSKRAHELLLQKSKIENQLATHGPWIEDWQGYQELRLPAFKARKIRFMFEKQFVRLDETNTCVAMVKQHDLSLVCRVLINSNEFAFYLSKNAGTIVPIVYRPSVGSPPQSNAPAESNPNTGVLTYSHGESDEFGFKAAVDKTTVYDFNATLLQLMGLDHERLTFYHNGLERRLTNVHGQVVKQVLA